MLILIALQPYYYWWPCFSSLSPCYNPICWIDCGKSSLHCPACCWCKTRVSYFIELIYFYSQIILAAYPGIQFRLPCTPPQDNFSWVPNCSLGPPGWETKVSSKKIWFGLCEIAWFLCQPIANLRRGVCL